MAITSAVTAVLALGYSVYSGEEGKEERKKARDKTKRERKAAMDREGAQSARAAGREAQARRSKQLAMQRRVAGASTGGGADSARFIDPSQQPGRQTLG